MSGWANHIEPIKGTRRRKCGMRLRQCLSQGQVGQSQGASETPASPKPYAHLAEDSVKESAVRVDLVTPSEAGGFALALKADAFWARTESDALSAPGVGRLAGAQAEASRLRAVLDGSRTFALAANEDAPPSSRLDGELGYGLAVFGGGLTGTPNVGFGLSDTARELRMGWRLTPARGGDFELSLDATRREAANDDGSDSGAGAPVEHGVMLNGAIRW